MATRSPGQPAGLAGELRGQLVPAGLAARAILALVGLGGLPQDLGHLALELVVGAVGPLGGVGGHLGPVQRDGAEADHPSGRAQLERFHQEPGQGLLVAGAEPRDGDVVGRLVGGQHPEGNVLDAAALDLPRGAHPDRVGVQQYAQQGLGVVGGVAVPVIAVSSVERDEVELVDHIQHEPGQVALGQPIAQVGGQQEGLVAVAPQKVVGHAEYYLFASLSPMILVLKGQWPGEIWRDGLGRPHARSTVQSRLALAPVVIGNAEIQDCRVKLREEGYELQRWP